MSTKIINYVVTYWDKDTDPVVTVFDNYEAADNCFKYFKKEHNGCCLDKCNVYKSFFISEG